MNLRSLAAGAIVLGVLFAASFAGARAASKSQITAIVFVRQGCYGRCPVDRVRFTSSGDVDYTGFRFIAQPGPYRGKISPAAFARLAATAQHDGFATFPDRFNAPATDTAEYSLTIERRGTKKTVTAGAGVSKGADDIASALDEARKATALKPTLALEAFGGFYQAIVPAAVYRVRVDYATDGTFTLEHTAYKRDPCYGQAVDPQVDTLTLMSDGSRTAHAAEESVKLARTATGLRMTRPSETVEFIAVESDSAPMHAFREPLPSCELTFDLNGYGAASAAATPMLDVHASVKADEAALIAHAHFHRDDAASPDVPATLTSSKFERDAGWYYAFTPETPLAAGARFSFVIDAGVRALPRGKPSSDFRCDASPQH